MGVLPGGIDSFIRGILRWAPDDLHLSVIGVTTDAVLRPLRKWTTCILGDKTFDFFPIIKLQNLGKQSRVPLTLRYVMALIRSRRQISADVLEFHRIEPCFAFLKDKLPMTMVMHQNMQVLRSRGSDIRWKYFPSLYFRLEDFILPRVQSIFCVREDAAKDYRQRFSDQSDHIHFTPTWVDTETFQPPSANDRRSLRESVFKEFDFSGMSRLFIWVGRLDIQKNPVLLVDAFHLLHQLRPEACLLIVGDGVLRGQVERRIKGLDLNSQIVLCGVKSPADIARYLKAADVFVLSSTYEGMPICILEALGSGLPVASTDVGEISRVVHPGVNGELTVVHEPDKVAETMETCLRYTKQYRGVPCSEAVTEFTPLKVLSPIYENYRKLAALPRE